MLSKVYTWNQLNQLAVSYFKKRVYRLTEKKKAQMSVEELEGYYFFDNILTYSHVIEDKFCIDPDGLVTVKKFFVDDEYSDFAKAIIRYDIPNGTGFVTVYQIEK